MVTRIIIARHGNVFSQGQTPTRVGAKTDRPLVEEHRARSIGKFLRDQGLVPDVVYAAPLQRTMQTAKYAIEAFGGSMQPIPEEKFKEIFYGPDENKTEEEVMLRLGNGNLAKGRKVIEAWNTNATVPDGWEVYPDTLVENWKRFATKIENNFPNHTILLVSSNGIIRFAPCLTGDFKTFARQHAIKVSTGGICIFQKKAKDRFWQCTTWNEEPYKFYTEDNRP